MKKRILSLCLAGRPTLFALFSSLLVLCLIGLVLPAAARSASVSLGWDANTEPDLAGYKLYYGTASRTYSGNLTVGNYSSCTISGLTEGRTYYFAVTAYNTKGLESPYSKELSYTIPAAPSTGAASFAVNAGGSRYRASGIVYRADTGYSGGTVYRTWRNIAGTSEDDLYKCGRSGTFSYRIPLADGAYQLRLKFAETTYSSRGRRVFDVLVGGQVVLSRLDIYARAGFARAYDVTIPVSVKNGALDIRFRPVVGSAIVAAIAVAK